MNKNTRDTEEQEPDYRAYLLRLWRTRGHGATDWRASLVSPSGNERHAFASLDDLVLFLRRQTQLQSGTDDAGDKLAGANGT